MWKLSKSSFKGKEEKIRLIGIDCPESRVNHKAKKDAQRSGEDIKKIIEMDQRATAFPESLVKKKDKVKVGYASLLTYPPNVRYLERFLKAY